MISDDLHGERLRLGICTICFGWIGYHYFYWRSFGRGLAILFFFLLFVAAGVWPAIILVLLGIYDGCRYLTMSDEQFAKLLQRKGNV